MNIHRGAKKIY
jgi:hypothetical protein